MLFGAERCADLAGGSAAKWCSYFATLPYLWRDTISNELHGNLDGLKASQLSTLDKLYRRDTSSFVIPPLVAARLTRISADINRTVGVLMDRRGDVTHVIVGDAKRLYLPDIGRQRAGTTRLRGLRLIRSVIGGDTLSRDDLTDLRRLRFDLVAVVEVGNNGHPGRATWAHLRTGTLSDERDAYEVFGPTQLGRIDAEFPPLIDALEGEIRKKTRDLRSTEDIPGILVYIKEKGDWHFETRIAELHDLADTAGLEIVDTIIQQRFKLHPQTAVGADKLEEIELRCLDLGAEILVFGLDLTPGQSRAISERTDLKVIDRTQLILDIFAQHAKTRGGKLQVELAQLKYALPRLVARNTAMSRLAGGIGGRGPGETKLELNRRRARDRIQRLEAEIGKLSSQRERLRQRRKQRDVPVVAIVGYTNAGKSTLLNTLTNAEVTAKSQLFATLDPTSRRLRFPKNRELVLTDTVGFIHDLPEELTKAFKATLEELSHAHLLIHLVDVSLDGYEERIKAVNDILTSLGLGEKQQLLVFNKIDQLEPQLADDLADTYRAIPIAAVRRKSLKPLVAAVEAHLWTAQKRRSVSAVGAVDKDESNELHEWLKLHDSLQPELW